MHASAKAAAQADSTRVDTDSGKTAVSPESPQQVPLWADAPLPAIQFKLNISQPDDAREEEADRVADQVMRTNAPAPQQEEEEEESGTGQTLAIQRKQVDEEDELPWQQPQIATTGPSNIQLKTDVTLPDAEEMPLPNQPGGDRQPNETLRHRLNSLNGQGQPLSSPERAFFESRFGHDFSRVRLHTGADAAHLAEGLRARAFTLGKNIVFGQGQYTPGSANGRRLVAHELAHVVQQTGQAQPKRIQRKTRDEKKKHDVIDYDKARGENLTTWYNYYKFYNLFREEDIKPGSTPIAYANHVYELQMKLETAFAGKWTAPEPGILETQIDSNSTLMRLVAVAATHHKDPTDSFGVDPDKLERIHKYYSGYETAVPKLVSEYFSGIPQLEAVNRNQYFFIQRDDRGDYVTRIQQALLALNYDLGKDVQVDKTDNQKEVTGVFGAGTKKAVINFQKDAGFQGGDVDGIVGQMTLRLLDKRIGAPAFKKPSVTAGSAYGFHIPVTKDDLSKDPAAFKEELLKRTLEAAFPITADQADVLIRSGWHWVTFRNLTQEDVDLGYFIVTIDKADYRSVVGQVRIVTGEKPDEPLETKLSGQAITLLKTSRIAELNKQIDDLEADLLLYVQAAGTPFYEEKRKKLERLKDEREKELNKLGITLAEYNKLKTDFIDTFEQFALLVAFQMLSQNEMQVNIEIQHYKNEKEVTAVKQVLAELAGKYEESEKLWWEAVSLQESKGKNKGLYTSESSYVLAHTETVVGGGMATDIFTGDPYLLFNETNIRRQYEALEKSPDPYFASWKEKEKEVVTTLQEATKKYPILAFPHLRLRTKADVYANMSDAALQDKFSKILEGSDDEKGVKQNIAGVRDTLKREPEKVWELPIVILRAQYELGLTEGPPVDLIQAKQKAVADKGFWESIGLAVLGIGLGLLALVSGPVGWLALGASIGVGAYDAYQTYQEISFKKETAGSAIDPASALGTEDPSYFWFWVSLVTIGLDVAQAAKAVKAVAKGAHLAKGTKEGLEAARATAVKSLQQAGEATAEGKAILKEIDAIDEALTKVSTIEFSKNAAILDLVKENPMGVIVMSEALRNKETVQAITTLGKLVEKDMFANAVRFYAGIGRESLDELPELVRLMKEGGLATNKALASELLSDPRVQRVLLDTQDPDLVKQEFSLWNKAIEAGESKSFVQHLASKNLATSLKNETKLVDMFGEAFTTLSNTVKNRYILRTVEPRLLDAFNAGLLSPELTRGMDVLLNSDVLAKSTRLGSAQNRVLKELELLGSLIETQSDFAKIAGLLDTPASRRALWSGATNLAGKETYVKLILKANGGLPPDPDVMDDLIRIGPMTDEGTVSSLIHNPGVRQALVENPTAVAVLKKCDSPCLPAFITSEQIVRVNTVMDGKSIDDVLRIREYLYANRESEEMFAGALKGLEDDFTTALKDIDVPTLKKPPAIDVTDWAIQSIISHGLPVTTLNKIMAKAAKLQNGSNAIYDLLRVLQFEKNVDLKNFQKLLHGLADGTPVDFITARRLLDESARFVGGSTTFRYRALQAADKLLGKFDLKELYALRKSTWPDSFVNTLYDVVVKLDGFTEGGASNADIVRLIKKAGGNQGSGDLGRLREILAHIKSKQVTIAEAEKAIEAADEFAGEVAKAMRDPEKGYEALAKLFFGDGVQIEEGVIKAKAAVGAKGSDAYEAVIKHLNQGQKTAETICSGTTIRQDRWTVFRRVINESDLSPAIKNKIIGEMWELVNAQYYRNLGYTVYREVKLTNGKTVARADLILEKGNKLIVVECKSGGATYSEGQEVIYPLLKEGKYDNVMVLDDETLATKFAREDTAVSFTARFEKEVVTPQQ